jgi:hypothetical protein
MRSSRPGWSFRADATASPSHPGSERDALQPGDVVTADGVSYVVADSEMERDANGGLRTASYLVERP